MISRLVLFLALAAVVSSCKPSGGTSALSPTDEKRLAELRELEERAAQRDAEAKMNQLDADRQKLAADQASLDEERRQLAAERAGAQNDAQRQAQYQQDERRLQQREAEQRAARERAEAAERAAETARDAHEEKRAAAAKKLDFFYDALDPLGDWMEVQPYGYVWQPREARDRGWRPYTDGTWVYTDYGWTWKANEPFGWATYHYGRWTKLHDRGWAWVPGSEWAPAWVSWRKSPNYVGWAPLPPEAHSSKGFNGAVDSYYDIGPGSYNFVAARSLSEPTYRGIVVDSERNYTIITETSNATRMGYTNYGREPVYYNQGPDYDEMNHYGGRPIPRYRLERESSREQFNGSAGSAVAGGVLRLLAPQIAPAARPSSTPLRVAAKLGTSAPDHGWGTGGNAQNFRNRAQEEATQAEHLARSQPAATPYIRSGSRPSGGPGAATPKPFGGPFDAATPAPSGNATPRRFGTSATPAAHVTPKPFVVPSTTPGPVGLDTPPPTSPRALPKATPTPPKLSEEATPPARPGRTSPIPPMNKGSKPSDAPPAKEATPPLRSSATPGLFTPRPGKPTPPLGGMRDPELATPKLKPKSLEGSGLGGENATPARTVPTPPKPIARNTPPPEMHFTPPPAPVRMTPPPRPPEGGAEPRKTMPPPPPGKAPATPAGSPTPPKKKP